MIKLVSFFCCTICLIISDEVEACCGGLLLFELLDIEEVFALLCECFIENYVLIKILVIDMQIFLLCKLMQIIVTVQINFYS